MEITKQQFAKHLLIEIAGLILVAIGAAGIMKVALGTGAYDALALSISSITAIEVGTVGLIGNCICIAIQILMLRKKYRLMFLLQIPVSFLMGDYNQLFLLHSICRDEFRFLYCASSFVNGIYRHLYFWRCDDDRKWDDRTCS